MITMNISNCQLPALWEGIWDPEFFLFFHPALKLQWSLISRLAQMPQTIISRTFRQDKEAQEGLKWLEGKR